VRSDAENVRADSAMRGSLSERSSMMGQHQGEARGAELDGDQLTYLIFPTTAIWRGRALHLTHET
jgi:hypothetical protein